MFLEKETKINWKRVGEAVSACVVFFLVAYAAFLGTDWTTNFHGPASLQASVLQEEAPLDTSESPASTNVGHSTPEITARAAIAVEFDNNKEGSVLFEKNSHERLPIASLAKIMTALVVMDSYDLGQKVTIDKAVMSQIGVQGVLKEGEIITVKDLLYVALIESSNRAAYALSEIMGTDRFIALMNQKAQELGLTDTYFSDSTGLDEKSYSTADNLVRLSGYLFVNYPLFTEIVGLKEYNLYLPSGAFHHTLQNTNELLGKEGIVGGKTGYTDMAKGCFMAIQKKNLEKNVIYVVLGADDRFLEMQKLINESSELQHQLSVQK